MVNILNFPIKEIFKKKGPATLKKLHEDGIHTLKDLLWVLPLQQIPIPEEGPFPKLPSSELFLGRGAILKVTSRPNFYAKGRGRAMLYNCTALVKDTHSDSVIEIKWFNIYLNFKDKISQLKEIIFLGEPQDFQGKIQFINPQLGPFSEKVIVRYPQINGIQSYRYREIIQKIPADFWEQIHSEADVFYPEISLKAALKILHGINDTALMPYEYHTENARRRLAFEELIQEQLMLLARKAHNHHKSAPIIPSSPELLEKFTKQLPFLLTSDQTQAIAEVLHDLNSGHPMMRLIQGDVGCGKTTVAFAGAFAMSVNNYQTGMMAPTESLALQHFLKFKEQFSSIPADILLGSTANKEKKAILSRLSDGTTSVVFGTHSLIQESVRFKNLGLVIVDEQHKFGVEQRIRLSNKGDVHSLIMTATPIPRSLRLTQFGDLDLSVIRSFPSTKKSITTKIVTETNFVIFLNFLNSKIKKGEQAFIVAPAITESVSMDLIHVEKIYRRFLKIFPHYKLAYLHGQMKPSEKENIFIQFKNRQIDILIATSVIEVGIDVPNANIMAIFNPERFGLSSLHQLRGRVGRGTFPGHCFLIVDQPLSENAAKRISIIEKTLDGFLIAEEDLKMRGEGNLFGEDQSGEIPTRKVADIIRDQDLLELAVTKSGELWKTLASDEKHISSMYQNPFVELTI
ncbi:MAG: ATP-dependent DNA helicase RecG [Bdellovibrio sp.]|nr:ATP-dependent DNA helicase RecG [Bdellovibrio sp.]